MIISKNKNAILTILVTAAITFALTFFLFKFTGGNTAKQTGGNAKSDAADDNQKTVYVGPMHPWIISDEPGQCPICGMDLVPQAADEIGQNSSSTSEREIAYWRAPMNPEEIYDKPGKSAMGMDLVPVYEDELVGGVNISIDPVTQQNMGLRTAEVVEGYLGNTIRTYGHITYDETRTIQVNLKTSGWIEKIHVDFTGKHVEKAQPLFELYSPELVAAQEEYLSTYRSVNRNSGQTPSSIKTDLLASARRRLQYFDVADSEISTIEKNGFVNKTLTIRSPSSGIVIEKNAEEGSYLKAGTTVYRIADLTRVWLEAHIFEYELPWVYEGQEVEMRIPYEPGKIYHGRVSFVYPYLQQKTRDVVIRLEFENHDLALKPDMYADVWIKTRSTEKGLIIPSEAVIRSGERNIVFVAQAQGKFTPRNVTMGVSVDDGMVQVLSGVAPGEFVVTSGQFLLDSESKLKEAIQKMMEAQKPPSTMNKEDQDDNFFDDMEAEEDDFFNDMETDPDDFFSDMEDE
ncbi:MAG: efflux RND transporter periplasmic adaptor subunit [Desulfobacterales bacterium]|jgi:Cu(I)/Ag(I) efflux system membrane fusion protein/cobalt-zinc-cadmium efflux system membrane fusion protein